MLPAAEEMDVVWFIAGLGILFCFVAIISVQKLGRVLRAQAGAIRRLTQRIDALEEMADPSFRRKIGDTAPSPLEQVFNFGFQLSDRFWQETLQATAAEMDFIRHHGTFVGSVKVERWRSHDVVTVTEVLPQSRAARWQTRSYDIYRDENHAGSKSATLWELPLAAPSAQSLAGPLPRLDLVFTGDALELGVRNDNGAWHLNSDREARHAGRAIFRVPLNEAQLTAYYRPTARSRDFDEESCQQNREADDLSAQNSPWIAHFEAEDEAQGVNWHLWLRDLNKKAEWERWKIWEPWKARKVG